MAANEILSTAIRMLTAEGIQGAEVLFSNHSSWYSKGTALRFNDGSYSKGTRIPTLVLGKRLLTMPSDKVMNHLVKVVAQAKKEFDKARAERKEEFFAFDDMLFGGDL